MRINEFIIKQLFLLVSIIYSIYEDYPKRDRVLEGAMRFLIKNFILSIFFTLNLFGEDWTWSYKKKFTINEAKELAKKPNIVFSKVPVPNFNQLIFCWNAFRPIKGHFVFYVQSRDSITKKWGEWFKMLEWGAGGVQKSNSIKRKEGASYNHVRLELPKDKLADGFKFKVESQGDADLSNLRLLGVSISDFSKFKSTNVDSQLLKFSPVYIKNIPKRSQMLLNHDDGKEMCSPTSTSMLIEYLSKKNVDPIDFANKVYDHGLGSYGSWPFNTACAFEACPSHFFRVIRLNSFSELYSYLIKGLPVVVSVRGKLLTAAKEYESGHLILICGWDPKAKKIICHDPAFDSDDKVLHKYDLEDFLRAWERSHHLCYVVEKRHED